MWREHPGSIELVFGCLVKVIIRSIISIGTIVDARVNAIIIDVVLEIYGFLGKNVRESVCFCLPYFLISNVCYYANTV